jgi:L-aspartate oxidase
MRGGDRSHAPAVILATGGAAALWARTTNPGGAVGGGMLLAHRAGARLADLEMMQFHPTAVVAPGAHDGYLVTEAIRGEGATLLNAAGERFVDELAPRDEVARAIFDELEASGHRSVSLDMRHVDPGLFPNVVAALRELGLDPEHGLIPVAPAAHYMMGGIATDLDARTSVTGLYAVGECACTGLHGANRLASNSLTECFVFGARAGRAALAEPALSPALINRSQSTSTGRPPPLHPASREALWRHAGLRRHADGLRTLTEDPHPLVGLIATAALHRRESRGAHRRDDFPVRDPGLDGRHVVLTPGCDPALERWS